MEDLLKLGPFDEDDRYAALDWLAEGQPKIEQRLYQAYLRRTAQPPVLGLYDVTSGSLEGEPDEPGAFGYNRDGKRGQKPIGVGLLTAADGEPLAVRVFEGQTADPATGAEQIALLKAQFGVQEVGFVGDRGRVQSKGKAALHAEGLRYITALTQARIRTRLKQGVLQPDRFDTEISEVDDQGRRLILRKNEATRYRESQRRTDKLSRLREKVQQRNAFVQAHLYDQANGQTIARFPRPGALQSAIFSALGISFPPPAQGVCRQ